MDAFLGEIGTAELLDWNAFILSEAESEAAGRAMSGMMVERREVEPSGRVSFDNTEDFQEYCALLEKKQKEAKANG